MAEAIEELASVAANLEESGWSAILSGLDADALAAVTKGLDEYKEKADEAEAATPDDPKEAIGVIAGKLTRIGKALKSHRIRFDGLDERIRALESRPAGDGGAGGSAGALDLGALPTSPKPSAKPRKVGRKPRKLKSMKAEAKEAEAEADDGVDKSRKHFYRFGSRNLQVVKPSAGYEEAAAVKEPPSASLELTYAHGYNGSTEDSRQNLILTSDGKYLIYFLAALCIRHDLANKTQAFFTEHNDDVTTICADPAEGSTLIASGQKDPKDEPGEGKDLPKIYVWDYTTMKSIQLIDDVCWGKVARVQWSTSGYLYVVCGDDDQTLKVWHKDQFKGKGQPKELFQGPTTKELIMGFQINPYPSGKFVDEFVLFGKRKFSYCVINKGKGDKVAFKSKGVPIGGLKKDGEKAFLCATFLPTGHYAIGAASGSIYICQGSNALGVVSGDAHSKAVGDILFDGKMLVSAGWDQAMKKWAIAKEIVKGKKMLAKKWEADKISIKGSDFVFQPRAMCYDAGKDVMYVGTKTNQIAAYEMKEEAATIVIDGHDGQIWGLCTHPKKNIYATGGFDNAVKLWDADTLLCVDTFEFELEEGDKKGHEVNCAAWSNDGKFIAFGTEGSFVFVFTYEPFKLVYEYQIPPKSKNADLEGVAYLRFSDDSKLLGCAHMDANLYVFGVKEDGSLEQWKPMPHIAAPTNVQFSADASMIKTLTRDYEVVHWNLDAGSKTGKFSPKIPDPDKLKWADDPLIAGWDVEGLYQPGWDGTDLNDATMTSDGKFVASGDDYGKVRLHPYPAIVPAANKCYGGHAEFVVGVEFLRDDSQLITCGGNDMAIFQWKLVKG